MIRGKTAVSPEGFGWDEYNRDKNWITHKVDFKESEEIFCNRPLKTYKDIKHSQGEDRFIALGVTNTNRKLYIVFTIRHNKIRIISARDMSRKERSLYEKR
jgi:uncharacterized protein